MKRVHLILISLVLIILVFIFTPLKYFNPILSGNPGWSKSIEESKSRNVFIAEFKPINELTNINDSTSIFIYDAWIEYMWTYKTFRNKSDRIQLKQLCLSVKSENMNYYGKTWYIISEDSNIHGMSYWKGTLKGSRIPIDYKLEIINLTIKKLDQNKRFPTEHFLESIGKIKLVKVNNN